MPSSPRPYSGKIPFPRNIKVAKISPSPDFFAEKNSLCVSFRAPKISPSPDFYKKLTVFTFYGELCITHSIV